ncbi:MAG TPA: STAS domain-containing protein [Roseiflexaceae bacterium]|nr:STAS domain-containing protein [Roseiflexaceae bacterium]
MQPLPARFGRHLAAAVETADLPQNLRDVLRVIALALAEGETGPMEELAGAIGKGRAEAHHLLSENSRAFESVRGALWQILDAFLEENPGWRAADVRAVEDLLHVYRNAFIGGYTETYQRIQSELVAQNEQIAAQRAIIGALSTPVLPLYDGVIVLPLVGSIDSYRASQIMERLLDAVTEQHAELVILDITGVPVVDTGVANYLIQTARSVRLIGAQVVLVGISPEIAQTIVQLGVSFEDIVSKANLRDGIAYATERRRTLAKGAKSF